MRRAGSLVVALLRDWARTREAVFFAVLFPVILLVIFSAVFAGGAPEFTVYVQNNDVGPGGEPTALSSEFVGSLERVEPLEVRSLDADRNLTEWSRRGERGATKRVLVVPEGFAERVRTRSRLVRIAVVSDTLDRVGGRLNGSRRREIRADLRRARGNATNATAVRLRFLTAPDDQAAPAVRGVLSSVVARFNERALGIEEPPVALRAGTLGEPGLGSTDYYLPAFIAAVVVINGVMTVPAVVAGFKHDGTFKRLVATPLRKRDWIVANVVQQSLLAVALMGVMVLVAHLLFGVSVVPGPLSVALVAVGAVGFSALGMTLGSLLSDPDSATSLGGTVAFPLMFLSGVFWELDVMPASLQTVGRLMPLYHFHRGLRRLMILDTTEGVLVPFLVLGGLAAVSVVAAAAVTGWRDIEE